MGPKRKATGTLQHLAREPHQINKKTQEMSHAQAASVVENEKRFRVDDDHVGHVASLVGIGQFERVCDLTYGPSGAESMQKDGWVLRIRTQPSTVLLEFKSPANPEWTSWNEISTTVGSASSTARMLEAIGLKPGLLLDRTRGEGRFHGAIVSLDQFPLLGTFVEIEVVGHDGLSKVDEVAAELGLKVQEPTRPYGELLLEYLALDEKLRQRHSQAIREFIETA